MSTDMITHRTQCHNPKFTAVQSSPVGDSTRNFVCENCGITVTVTPVPSRHHAEEQAHVAESDAE